MPFPLLNYTTQTDLAIAIEFYRSALWTDDTTPLNSPTVIQQHKEVPNMPQIEIAINKSLMSQFINALKKLPDNIEATIDETLYHIKRNLAKLDNTTSASSGVIHDTIFEFEKRIKKSQDTLYTVNKLLNKLENKVYPIKLTQAESKCLASLKNQIKVDYTSLGTLSSISNISHPDRFFGYSELEKKVRNSIHGVKDTLDQLSRSDANIIIVEAPKTISSNGEPTVSSYTLNNIAPLLAELDAIKLDYTNASTDSIVLNFKRARDYNTNIMANFPRNVTIDALPFPAVIDSSSNNNAIKHKKLCIAIGNKWFDALYIKSKPDQFAYKDGKWELLGARRGYMYEHNFDATTLLAFKELPHEIKDGAYTPKTYYGIELEVEPRSSDTNVTALRQRTSDALGVDYVVLKRDGSLGPTGFEIVTAPSTLAYHQTKWNTFFKDVAKDLRSWDADNCGMHVHISRNSITPLHLGKILGFYNNPENRTFIRAIAGRNSERYAKLTTDQEMTSAVLGLPRNKGSMLNATLRQNGDSVEGKYAAVNIGKSATVEIRIFRGNVSKIGFFKNLEFVDAVVQYTKNCYISIGGKSTIIPAKDRLIRKSPNFSLNYTDFLLWLDNDKSGCYNNLKMWLAKSKFLTDKVKEIKSEKAKEFIIPTEEILKVA